METRVSDAVVVELLLGLVTALLLNRDTPLAQVLRRILVLPLMIAPVLGTLIWKLMMNPSFGVANWLLGPFGLRNFTWGDSPNTALWTLLELHRRQFGTIIVRGVSTAGARPTRGQEF